MYKVIGKDTIEISRGDYVTFPIKLNGVNDGETVIFSVAKKVDSEPVIEKSVSVSESTATITLERLDTAGLESGTYCWDITMPDYFGEGRPHTPLTPRVFKVLGVSHRA